MVKRNQASDAERKKWMVAVLVGLIPLHMGVLFA
jgi:hypothetical protein